MADENYARLACKRCCAPMLPTRKADGSARKNTRQVCHPCAHQAKPDGWKPCARNCVVCGAEYLALQRVAMYCGNACKVKACKRRTDPDFGYRAAAKTADAATMAALAAELREARSRANERAWLWAREQRKRVCKSCGVVYSTLGRATDTCCSPECSLVARRECKRANRIAGKAIKRAATVEVVSPQRVFERDGWRCYLCGCDTPQALRGTYEANAPELEHMVPLSRGGAHSYANTRCACRACNLIKGDRTVDEVGGPAVHQ
jgi:5-methylcytosine-specific restriction endonuclease McrA